MQTSQWEKRGSYFNFENHQIFYYSQGKGSIIFLLHGFPTSSWDWYKVIDKLSENNRVICYDMIGYGFSDKPTNNDYSIFQQADIASALLAHLQVQEVHVFAHDKGDTVANELLARQLEGKNKFTIKSCCMLNGGLFPGIHKPRPVQRALMTPIGKYIARFYTFSMFKQTFYKIFGPNTKASEQELNDLWALMNHKDGMKIFHKLIYYMQDRIDHEERWLSALQKTTIPLRLIDGAADPISGKHLAEHYEEVIPNPDVVLLDQIGHYPQIEASDAVVMHYFEFYNKHHAS